MKVLIINEPFVDGFNRTQRWAARTRGRVLRAPDWLAYATAVLETEGVDARLYDFPAEGWGKDRLRELVKREQPDFVVLDSTTPSIYSDIECARICKEECRAHVVMVGPHASALPEETLLLAGGAVDVVCIGEYDYTVRDVVANYSDLSQVNGICYRDSVEDRASSRRGRLFHGAVLQDSHTPAVAQRGCRRTGPRPLIENLDDLPFPAWHHLDLMKYFDGSKLYPYIDIFSGRGCSHRCIFCLWPQVMHGHRIRLRSPKNVVDEIERDILLCPSVVRGGEFFFEDDTFTLVKSNAMAICEEILRRGLKITFSVNARTDTADEEMFRLLKRAGCRELLVGFESGDDEVLEGIRKQGKLEDALRFMELARKCGLFVHGCFVLGLPGETEKTMEKTIQFALGAGLHTVQFSAAVPFPGTRYYQFCRERGLLTADRWDAWLDDGEQAPVIEHPGLSKEVVKKAVDQGLKRFYFRPAYMMGFLLSTKSPSDLYRKVMGTRNFLSYLWNQHRKI